MRLAAKRQRLVNCYLLDSVCRFTEMRSQPSIFLIDIDGVACEHAKAICNWVAKEYVIESTEEDVTTWDYDFGPISFVEAVRKCYPDADFILGIEVTPGFPEFVESLAKVMTAKFASARPECAHSATRQWIRENFETEFEVIFAKEKANLHFDYLVDDCPDEIVTAAAKGRTCFLFDRPWNRSEEIRANLSKVKGVHVANSFDDIANVLNIRKLPERGSNRS